MTARRLVRRAVLRKRLRGVTGAMTLADMKTARGVNWYGVEDNLRGPTLAELQEFKARGYSLIRLPVAWDTTNATIDTILTNADTANIWVGVDVHNYGRIGGTASITATDGTTITAANQQQWFDKCVDQLNAFKNHKSYVPLDMNEPKQTGAQWEPIAAGRVAAMRATGYTGIIGVSAAQLSSAGAINNPDNHPGGWWISDPNSFIEVHQYLQPLADTTLQTRAQLDAWVVSSSGQADLTTYNQYVARAFGWGALGSPVWANVPMFIGEFAMPPGMELELETFLAQMTTRQVGGTQWAGGMWPDTYNWKMTEAQYNVLSGQPVTPPPDATSWAATNEVASITDEWSTRTDTDNQLALTTATAGVRTGNKGLALTFKGTAAASAVLTKTDLGFVGTSWRWDHYWKVPTALTFSSYDLAIARAYNGGTLLWELKMTQDRSFFLQRYVPEYASGTYGVGQFALNTWTKISMRHTGGGTAAGALSLLVNDTVVSGWTGLNSTGTWKPDRIEFGALAAITASGTMYFDDGLIAGSS